MITSKEIKEFILKNRAERCGIAGIDRFSEAPEGYKPTDIYKDCQSVIVFLKQMPTDVIMTSNPVPYTHTASLLYNALDNIGLELSNYIQKKGKHGIPIPSDNPYLYWDDHNKHGKGILSMRHSAYLAGLGILGKNNLLINEDLGNMVYIGAILTDAVLESDPLVKNFHCPPKCNICLENCPPKALNGITVNQKLCREYSFYKNKRGFDIYDCNRCRKLCVLRTGKRK